MVSSSRHFRPCILHFTAHFLLTYEFPTPYTQIAEKEFFINWTPKKREIDMHKTTPIVKALMFFLAAFFIPQSLIAADKPEIFVQLGHAGDVTSVAFSSDGQYILSGGKDNTVKLWDVSTGKEIRTFRGHSGWVCSLAFTPDGRYAVSGSSDKTIKIWNIETGGVVRTFSGEEEIQSMALSPDGRYLFAAGKGYDFNTHADYFTLKVLGLEDGKKLWVSQRYKGFEPHVAFFPDGKHVLTSEGGIKMWEMRSGKLIREFADSGYDSNIAISPDGKRILTAKFKDLRIWDVEMGVLIKELSGHGTIETVAFSPDGRYALSGCRDNTVRLWNVEKGQEIRTFTGHKEWINAVVFSPDGRYALSGSSDNTLRLWDVQKGREVRTYAGNVSPSQVVAYSPDRGLVVSASGHDLHLWDASTGNAVGTLRGHADWISSVVFLPGGRSVLSASGSYQGKKDNSLRLWDVSTGREVRSFIGHLGSVDSAVVSPDGKYALSDSSDKTMRLWEIATGRVIRTFSRSASCITFSGDGRTALSVHEPSNWHYDLRVWDTKTGRNIRTFPLSREGFGHGITFSPDSRYLLTNLWEVWETSIGRKIQKLSAKDEGFAWSAAFSPDNEYILLGHETNIMSLWDVASGKKIRQFSGHVGCVKSVAFTPDGRYAISGSSDGTVRIWDIPTEREIVQMAKFSDGEWIAMTPEGYYSASANGDSHMNVRIGNSIYSIDQYRSTFYRPQVVEAALRLGDTQRAIVEVLGTGMEKPTAATIQTIEPPSVEMKSPKEGKKITSSRTEISAYIRDRNQPIQKVTVYVNGRIASSGESRGIEVTPKTGLIVIPEGRKSLDVKIPVALESGENLIEVVAFNGFSEGRKSVHVYFEELAAEKKETILPNLWILAIGINAYEDKSLASLSYGTADAEEIVNAFKGQKGKLFRMINSLIISDSSALKPTYENIADNLNYLSRAGHNDVVILFIAGHGINDDRGDFYFLPSDAVILQDGTLKRSRAISWRELKSLLDLPSKKIIFADTCHSEGIAGKKTRAVNNERFVKELQEANAVIFTSSRGRELSQESDTWGHGAFTYALIQGIKGKANLIRDNRISMKELDTYVSETVPKLTNGAQHPITNTPDGYVNFPVAIVE